MSWPIMALSLIFEGNFNTKSHNDSVCDTIKSAHSYPIYCTLSHFMCVGQIGSLFHIKKSKSKCNQVASEEDWIRVTNYVRRCFKIPSSLMLKKKWKCIRLTKKHMGPFTLVISSVWCPEKSPNLPTFTRSLLARSQIWFIYKGIQVSIHIQASNSPKGGGDAPEAVW